MHINIRIFNIVTFEDFFFNLILFDTFENEAKPIWHYKTDRIYIIIILYAMHLFSRTPGFGSDCCNIPGLNFPMTFRNLILYYVLFFVSLILNTAACIAFSFNRKTFSFIKRKKKEI